MQPRADLIRSAADLDFLRRELKGQEAAAHIGNRPYAIIVAEKSAIS